MKFCIALAYNDPREFPALGCAAEKAGFGGLILSDHLVYPVRLDTLQQKCDGIRRFGDEVLGPLSEGGGA